MTAWTEIPNTVFEVGKPARAVDMRALRDNFAAMGEGATGAPSVLPNVASRSGIGRVGTYVFAKRATAADAAPGSTVAGSDLLPTSAANGVKSMNNADRSGWLDVGSELSGTWRCMGLYDHQSLDLDGGGSGTDTAYLYGATLWLRIA